MQSLLLKMKYDDGYVAYLNGVEVARRNVPTTAAWNSLALGERTSDTEATTVENLDVTPYLNLLTPTGNVLAIQVLMSSTTDGALLSLPTMSLVTDQANLFDPAGHGGFVHLYINGLYCGLYNPVERPDTAFTAKHMGGDKDNWDAVNAGQSINSTDMDGFTAAYLAGNLDADFYSTNVRVRTPDALITTNDVDGFTAMYLAALSSGKHLNALPLTGGGSEGGLAELAAAGGGGATAPLGQAAPLMAAPSPTVVDGALVSSASAPAPSETATPSAASGAADALGLAAPASASGAVEAASGTDDAVGLAAPVAYGSSGEAARPASDGSSTSSAPVALISGEAPASTSTPGQTPGLDDGLEDILAMAEPAVALAV